MMRELMVLGAVFLGGFSLLPIDAFADAGLGFSVNISDTPILEINLSDANGSAIGATTTMDVVPDHGTAAFNEKTMVVSVGTNNEWGYNLVMSVSNTSLISTEDGSKTIPTLTAKEGGYTCTVATASSCDFTANAWGYKLNAATNLSAATNYLPLQSSINLNSNTSRVTTLESTSISFGSKVNATLAPGTYQTTINFAATANPDPTPIMQNITTSTLASLMPSDGNTTTLKDSRDNNKYQITNISGAYWMTDNLRFTGTSLTPADTNVMQTTTMTYFDLKSNTGSYDTSLSSYVSAGIHYDSTDVNNNYGAYYNYCAASAGTVCNNTTKQDATVDICPKGWRLPTKTEITTIKDNNGTNFNPVLAGMYNYGILDFGGTPSGDWWWSATAYDTGIQYSMFNWDGNGWKVLDTSRDNGFSVRCVYDIPTMQNMTSNALAELMPTDGSTTTLPDSRDGNVYNIARIGDTYWMTDNLKIMGTISASDSNFTGADFNISAGGDLTAGNTYTEPRAHYNTSDENSSTYGAYYNYCAASAGTVCSQTQQDATQDICPKGWRLPTQTEIINFKNASSSNKNPVLAGYYSGGSLDYASSRGYWWSATARNINNQYRLYYNGSSWSADWYSKNYGNSVRCIYGPLPPTMQNVTSAKLAALVPNNGDIITLPDERDGTEYTVGRLADGKVWMLDNLALDLTNNTTLDNTNASNTNASATTLEYFKGERTGVSYDQYATAAVSDWERVSNKKSYSAPLVYASYKDITEPLAMGQSGTGKVGVYYNYCAASAGSYCYGNGGTSSGSPSDNATEDICPRGWRMPTNGSFGEYKALYTAYSSDDAAFVNALRTPLSGYVYDSGYTTSLGYNGYFWSSTYASYTDIYRLSVSGTSIYYQSPYYRYEGYSVRCLFGS